VPIGSAPIGEINALVDYYHDKFKVDVTVLPPMQLDATDVDTERKQLVAESVVESMRQTYPEYAVKSSVVMIGITGQDMYLRSEDWAFCFGWRDADNHAAVVSTARMDLHYRGEPKGEATLRQRLRKMVTKDIGILYYGKSPNDDPKSVLYGGILGIQELDQVGEDF